MKKIIFVHGIKGGTGKSLCASMLIDFMIDAGLYPTIVECDGSSPDVGKRFNKLCNALYAPITDQDSVYSMLNIIERHGTDYVVVNTPPSKVIFDECSVDIEQVLTTIGYSIRTIFMLDNGVYSARLAGKSLSDGLVARSIASLAIVSNFYGNELSNFAWFKSKERKAWLAAGRQEMSLPLLSSVLKVDKHFQECKSFINYSNDENTLTANRLLMNEWLENCHPIFSYIAADYEVEPDNDTGDGYIDDDIVIEYE